MKLKLDDAGHAVLQDGKVVMVHDDGKEIAFDHTGTVATISRLNKEAQGHREAKERAEALLKAFDGIEDPAAARKALETVANLNSKQLVDAGEVERVKSEVGKAWEDKFKGAEEKYRSVVKERDSFRSELTSERIGGAFSRSKFIEEKIAVPKDMIQAAFGHSFKDEGGAVVGYSKDGNKILSRTRPGEIADFDEALEIMVDAYPNKDHILKGSGASGGGAGGGGKGGSRTYSRAEFNQIAATNPAKAREISIDVGAGKAQLVD